MLDDSEIDTPSGPVPYPAPYGSNAPQSMTMSPTTTGGPPISLAPAAEHALPMQPPPTTYPSMTQLLDSGLEWDPFGLSASMAFPTQFSFDPSNNMR
jgi:hypothetical protein